MKNKINLINANNVKKDIIFQMILIKHIVIIVLIVANLVKVLLMIQFVQHVEKVIY